MIRRLGRLGLFLSLTLLLGLTLGCSVFGLIGGGEETPPPAEAPPGGDETSTPTEASPSGGTEAEEELSLSSVTGGLQSLDSYRSHFRMTFEGSTGGEAEQWVMEMDMEYVREPSAQRIVVQGGMAGEGFETVQIGDQQYVVFGEEQCVSSSADEGDAMDMEIFEPADVLGGLDNARRIRPDEKINGILCRHYAFDETSIAWAVLSHAEGEVWVAVDGDYVVKYVMQADGKDPASQDEGHIEWEYETRDVNKPITIEPPSGCEAAESEFPIMSDATGVTTMGGMVMYESASSFDDVLAFYQEQMLADGWSETGDSFTSPGTAILSYTKDERTVSITLAGENGTVSVMIMGE